MIDEKSGFPPPPETAGDIAPPKTPHSTIVPAKWKAGEDEDESLKQVDVVEDDPQEDEETA